MGIILSKLSVSKTDAGCSIGVFYDGFDEDFSQGLTVVVFADMGAQAARGESRLLAE